MYYDPHIGHAVSITFLGITLGTTSVLFHNEVRSILLAAAVLCVIMVLTILLLLIWDANTRYYNSVAKAASEVAKLDDYKLQIFAMTFPSVRLRWANNIKPVAMFDDCEVATMAHLAIFINGSNNHYVFPKRDWHGTVEFRGETITLTITAYEEILDTLIEKKLVVPDSASGPRSWLWVDSGTTYSNVRKYWNSWITRHTLLEEI